MKAKLTLLFSLILIASARAQAEVLPPDFTLFGKTSGEYTAEWYKYIYSISTNGDYLFPGAGPVGDDRVYYLERTPAYYPSRGIQNYTVPDDVYLFFPIIAYEWDNVDAATPLTPEQMRDALRAYVDAIIAAHATIDGVAVTNLLAYRTESPVFSMFLTTADNYFSLLAQHPVIGLVDPIVAGGYLIMVKPLTPGLHDVRTDYTILAPDSLFRERHYQINVFHTNRPPVADASGTAARVISPDNLNAKVVLDGARSSDRENDPLTYSWLEGGAVIGAGILATNTLAVGSHHLSLVVSDGQLSATNTIAVEVLTPCEALGELAGAVEAAHLARKKARPLVEELREACAAFEHAFRSRHHDRLEHLTHAIHELLEFQHEVQEDLGRGNPALASLLIDGAQEVIEAVKPAPRHHHREKEDDEHDRD